VCNILPVLIWLHFIPPAYFPPLSSWKHLYLLRTCFILLIVGSTATIFSNPSCTASGECERISSETGFSLEKLQSQHCENLISEHLRSVRVWFTFFPPSKVSIKNILTLDFTCQAIKLSGLSLLFFWYG